MRGVGRLMRCRHRVPKSFGQPGNAGLAVALHLFSQRMRLLANPICKLRRKRCPKGNQKTAHSFVEFFDCHGRAFRDDE